MSAGRSLATDGSLPRGYTGDYVYEVELKIEGDHETVRDRLEATDARHLGEVEQTDTYFDAPDRSFADTDEALRLRREQTAENAGADTSGSESIRITYKGPLVDDDSKTRKEFETTVGDRAEAERILEGLGYTPAATVEKIRRRYRLDGYTLSLDTVSEVGQYVEIEREVPEKEVSEAKTGAKNLLRQLDLDPESQIQTSYLGMKLTGE